jgi:hypothetical protein
VLLAVGRLVYLGGDINKPLALAGELCSGKVLDDGLGWRIWKPDRNTPSGKVERQIVCDAHE